MTNPSGREREEAREWTATLWDKEACGCEECEAIRPMVALALASREAEVVASYTALEEAAEFMEAAIRDAVECEDGLDGGTAEKVLRKYHQALATLREGGK